MVGSVCEGLAWLWDGVARGCSTIEAWEQWQKVGDATEYLIKVGNTQLTAPLCPRPLNHCQCPTMQIRIVLHQGKWYLKRKKIHKSSRRGLASPQFFCKQQFTASLGQFCNSSNVCPRSSQISSIFPLQTFSFVGKWRKRWKQSYILSSVGLE